MQVDALVDIIEKPTWKTLLVKTVREERMDPWSIDVVHLASKYADRIKNIRINDFRIPANAVLASSILVRFKSDSWELTPQEEEQDSWEEVEEYEELGILEPPVIEAPRRVTSRRVTLDELVEAVETVMDKTKKKASGKRIARKEIDIRLEEKEEFDKTMKQVYQKVLRTADSEGLTMFSNILEEDTRSEVVKVLLSLLHLAYKEKIAVWQEKQFDEIFVLLKENSGKTGKKKDGKQKNKEKKGRAS